MDNTTIALVAAVLSLIGAFATAVIATLTAVVLARSNERNEKRRLCLLLREEFDGAPMFHHRYEAWKSINAANLPAEVTISELFERHWDEHVSAVVHFFESLEQFCGQGLIDPDLAVTLFARPYRLWHDLLLSRLRVDAKSEYYLPWLTRIGDFAKRLPPEDKTAVPATDASVPVAERQATPADDALAANAEVPRG